MVVTCDAGHLALRTAHTITLRQLIVCDRLITGLIELYRLFRLKFLLLWRRGCFRHGCILFVYDERYGRKGLLLQCLRRKLCKSLRCKIFNQSLRQHQQPTAFMTLAQAGRAPRTLRLQSVRSWDHRKIFSSRPLPFWDKACADRMLLVSLVFASVISVSLAIVGCVRLLSIQ